MRIRRILLAADLAPHSDRAMERAVRLAAEFGAELGALHARNQPAGSAAGRWARLSDDEIADEIDRHLVAVPMAGSLAVRPWTWVVDGPLDEALATRAAEWGADLLVAGLQRPDLIDAIFALTTIEMISAASPVPLLVVRNKPFGPYADALVPVDFLSASRPGLEMALSLVGTGRLDLIHVLDLPGEGDPSPSAAAFDLDAAFTGLLAGLDLSGRTVETRISQGSVIHELTEIALMEKPSLIVMGTRGLSGLGRILLGSTAHDMLEHLPSDVLLVRAG